MVSISKYPCFCSANVTRFTSKKDGRGFLKCSRETCTLFVQEEQYKTLMEAYDSQVDARFKPNNFPLCYCNEVTALRVSKSEANFARPYFKCQIFEEEDRCIFFQWADSKVRKYRPVERKRKSETESSAEKPENSSRKRVLKIDSSSEEES